MIDDDSNIQSTIYAHIYIGPTSQETVNIAHHTVQLKIKFIEIKR